MVFRNRMSCADSPTSYPACVYQFSRWWSRLPRAGFRYVSLSIDECKIYDICFFQRGLFSCLALSVVVFWPPIVGSKSSLDFHDHQNIDISAKNLFLSSDFSAAFILGLHSQKEKFLALKEYLPIVTSGSELPDIHLNKIYFPSLLRPWTGTLLLEWATLWAYTF